MAVCKRGTFSICNIHEFMLYFIQNNFVKIDLNKKRSKFLLRICGAESQFSYVKIFHINVKIIHSTPPPKNCKLK